jgi:hypothetical protein
MALRYQREHAALMGDGQWIEQKVFGKQSRERTAMPIAQ